MVYWYDGLVDAANCWRAKERAGVEFTDEERVLLRQAGDHLSKAKDLVSQIYSKRIGDQVTLEIRIGAGQ